MRAIEPWVATPLESFLTESAARVVLLTTSAGQVIAQHGFTRSLDVMTAAALGAAICASTEELARQSNGGRFDALVHQGNKLSLFLSAFDTPRGRWIGLVVYGEETSVGLVQLFFAQLVRDLGAAAPVAAPAQEVLAENFEHELNASLRALFGR